MKTDARKITNASGQKIIGRFYSHKLKLHVIHESLAERNYFYSLDFDGEVESFVCQPVTIPYFDGVQFRKYTPDVKVNLKNNQRPLYVEVKPSGQSQYWEFLHKASILEKTFNAMDADFQVVTTDITDAEPNLTNLKLLHRYGSVELDMAIASYCIAIIRQGVEITFSELLMKIGNSPNNKMLIYKLIFINILSVDMCKRISPQSIISLGKEIF